MWDQFGTPSVVDWCEPNYIFHPWIAEFWNTLTSLVITLFGLLGLYQWRKSKLAHELRFGLGFLGIASVGLGSAAFHGTLLRFAQALDELPMLAVGLVGVWVVWHRASPLGSGRAIGLGMLGYGLLFMIAYAWIPGYFELFLASYGLVVSLVVCGGIWFALISKTSVESRRWFIMGSISYYAALLFFWMPEHVIFPCDHPIQALQLHAFWHLLAGMGTWCWFRWAICDRVYKMQSIQLQSE